MNVFENQAVIEGRSTQSISVSGTAASAFVTEPGVYAVWCDVDTFIRNDVDETTAEDVTTSTGLKMTANQAVFPLRITRPSFLAGIAGSSGTLYYHKIS